MARDNTRSKLFEESIEMELKVIIIIIHWNCCCSPLISPPSSEVCTQVSKLSVLGLRSGIKLAWPEEFRFRLTTR